MRIREREEAYPNFSVREIIDERAILLRVEKHNEGFFSLIWRSSAGLSQFLTYMEEYFSGLDEDLSRELLLTIFPRRSMEEKKVQACSLGPDQWDAVRPLTNQDFISIGADSPSFVRVDTSAGSFTFSPYENEIGFLSPVNFSKPEIVRQSIQSVVFKSSDASIHSDLTRFLGWASTR